MSSKRSMSWPRSSHQEPNQTKEKNQKRNEKRLLTFEEFFREHNAKLEREGYDISTGLPNGVTQEEFDKANADFRKQKSETACSKVECQPVTID